MKVAITGATGVIGRFIVSDLVERGYEVVALVRPTSDRSGFSQQAPRWITGDLQDEHALDALMGSAEALVHCALDHIPRRYRGGEGNNPSKFWQANLLGTVSLLEAAHRHRLKRVVLLSSRAVFDGRQLVVDKPVSPIEDDHPLCPDTHYGALKASVEALARVYSVQGLTCAALRPTGVYGLGHPLASSKWFDLACQARLDAPAPAERIAGEVHGGDVASACHLLLTAPDELVSGRGFNCSDVVVSRRGLYERMRQLAHDKKLPAQTPMVQPPQALDNLMRCDGLLDLGWQPGGEQRLEETVAALAAAAVAADQPS